MAGGTPPHPPEPLPRRPPAHTQPDTHPEGPRPNKAASVVRAPRQPRHPAPPLPGASLKGLPPDIAAPPPPAAGLPWLSPGPKAIWWGPHRPLNPPIQLSLGAPRPRQALGQLQRAPRPLRVPRLTQPPTPPPSSSWWASSSLPQGEASPTQSPPPGSAPLSAALLSLRSHPQWPVPAGSQPRAAQGLQPIPCHSPT